MWYSVKVMLADRMRMAAGNSASQTPPDPPPPSLGATFEDSGTNTFSSQSSQTFSSLSLGTTHASRIILVCFTMEGGVTVTGVTLGGTPMTLIGSGTDTSAAPDIAAGMWYLAESTLSSATVVVSFSSSVSGVATVSIINVLGVTSLPDDTYAATNSPTVNLTVASGGQGICCIGVNATSITPSNCTEIADITTGSDTHFVGYYTGASGSVTFGSTGSATTSYGVGVAFS